MTRSVDQVGNFASPVSSFSLSFSLYPGLPPWFPAPFSGCGAPFFLSFPPVLPGPALLLLWSCSLPLFSFFPSFLLRRLWFSPPLPPSSRSCASSSPVGVVVWLLSLACRFSWCSGAPLPPMSATLGLLSLWLKWGFGLSHSPLLLSSTTARSCYAAWFNTSVFYCPFLGIQHGSTCVPSATYAFALASRV